jgi:YVTN family beta-propeller protein
VGANGEERAYLSSFTVRDVNVLEKATLPRCAGSSVCISYVLGRYSPAYAPTYYRVGLLQTAGKPDIYIRAQRNDGSSLSSDIDTGLAAANGASVNLRVEFVGANPTTVRARAWLAGTQEPSTWRLSVTDSTAAEQGAGMVGVRLRNEDSTSHSFAIQSYQASGAATPVSVAPNPTGLAHLLYVVVDGTVYVYDIDNGHKLVKQFAIPEAGKRGVLADPKRGLLYITECGMSLCNGKNGSMLAYDLVHDVVAWIANYSFGIDQAAVTPDGSTIYMPHGLDATDGIWTVLDASDGKPTASIVTGTNDGGHNTIVSLDGTEVYLAGHKGTTANYIHVLNPLTNQITQEVGPVLEGIGPFTITGKHTLAFTTSIGEHCGFQVLNLTAGNVLYTVHFSGSCGWITGDSDHGISLSPDETKLYIIDAPLDQLKVYNVSGLPGAEPTEITSIPLSSVSGNESPCQSLCEREGWVLNDLSGRYVYVADSGDVVDTTTNSVIATLPSLQNTREPIEVDWANGTPSATSTRFGLGRVTG